MKKNIVNHCECCSADKVMQNNVEQVAWFGKLLPWLAQTDIQSVLLQSDQLEHIGFRSLSYSGVGKDGEHGYKTMKHAIAYFTFDHAVSTFVTTFLYEGVSVPGVLSYKQPKRLKMLLKLMTLCEMIGSRYMLRRSGLPHETVKRLSFEIRRKIALLSLDELDLVNPQIDASMLTDADAYVLDIMLSQLGVAAVRVSEYNEPDAQRMLEETLFDYLLKINGAVRHKLVEYHAYTDENEPDVSQLVIHTPFVDDTALEMLFSPRLLSERPWAQFALMDRLVPTDITRKEGPDVEPPGQRGLKLFCIERVITSFDDVTQTLEHLIMLLEQIENTSQQVKCPAHMKVCLIQEVFTCVLPIPIGRLQKQVLGDDPVWDPDFKDRRENDRGANAILHEERVYVMTQLKSIMEHFVAAVFSQEQNRLLDAVRVIVAGAMATMVDAMMRYEAPNVVSCLSDVFAGRHVSREARSDGQVYGAHAGLFAKQIATTYITTPELALTKTRVLDYFSELELDKKGCVMSWELQGYTMMPEQATSTWLSAVADVHFAPFDPKNEAAGRNGSTCTRYPEFVAYRDVTFFWKYLLIPCPNTWYPYQVDRLYKSKEARANWQDTKNGGDAVQVLGNHLLGDLKCQNLAPQVKKGQRYASDALAVMYTGTHNASTEDDILHIKTLDSAQFDKALNQQEIELVLSFLTVPYMRIPLLLNFYASEDRIHCLRSEKLRGMLEACMFEPGKHLDIGNAGTVPEVVPTNNPDLLGTPYSHLLQELAATPESVLDPILHLNQACSALKGSCNASNAPIILFMARLSARVTGFVRTMLLCINKQHPSIAAAMRWRGVWDADVTPKVVTQLTAGLAKLREQHKVIYENIFDDWLDQLQEMAKADATKVDENTQKMNNVYGHLLLIYTQAFDPPKMLPGAKLQPISKMAPLNEAETKDVVIKLMSISMMLTTKHTWNRKSEDPHSRTGYADMDIPEIELFDHINKSRRIITAWMAHAAEANTPWFQEALGTVHEQVMASSDHASFAPPPGDERPTRQLSMESSTSDILGAMQSQDTMPAWAFIRSSPDQENLGRYGVLPNVVGDNKTVYRIPDGITPYEINFQTNQILMAGRLIQALDRKVVEQRLVRIALEKSKSTSEIKQCVKMQETRYRTKYFLLNELLIVEQWAQDPSPAINHLFLEGVDREYPDELGDDELWVHAIFEPIKNAHFDPGCRFNPFYKPNTKPRFSTPLAIQFFIRFHEHTEDDHVAFMLMKSPLTGKPWKEIVVLRDWKCILVFGLFEQGRRYFRRLEYASNTRFCLADYQAGRAGTPPTYVPQRMGDVGGFLGKNPSNLWPSWARHEGYMDCFPYEKTDANDPPIPRQPIVIRRALPSAPATEVDFMRCENQDHSEVMLDEQCLYGTVPAVLLDHYEFWQDVAMMSKGLNPKADSPATQLLRGYPKDPANENIIFVEVEEFDEDADNENLILFPFPGLHARILRQPFEFQKEPKATPMPDEPDCKELVDLLYAPTGTHEHDLALIFSRIENLSHVLCWTRRDAARGVDGTFTIVELPRLKLTFEARREKGHLRLWSVDHGHLFIDVKETMSCHPLFKEIPYSLVLRTESKDCVVLLPNRPVQRPQIKGMPFSVETVVDRNNGGWIKNSVNAFYLFNIHVSGTFAFAPSIEAELYLLMVFTVSRAYTPAFQSAGRVATDIPLSDEALQTLENFITHASDDGHPHAHSVLARTYLNLVDAPIRLESVDPVVLMVRYIPKRSHVNAQCRLTEQEELDLLDFAFKWIAACALLVPLVENEGGRDKVAELIAALSGHKECVRLSDIL